MTDRETPADPVSEPTGGADEQRQPERSRTGTWAGLAVIGGVLLVYLLAQNFWLGNAANVGTDHPGVGIPVGALALDPLTATGGVGRQDLDGKVTLINYWGPWCGHCLQEFPHLVELERGLADEPDFQFLSVSCRASPEQTIPQLKQDTERQLASSGAQFDVYIDTSGASRQSLMMLANIDRFGLPMTMLVDRQGVVRALWEGYRAGDELQVEAVARKLLAEK